MKINWALTGEIHALKFYVRRKYSSIHSVLLLRTHSVSTAGKYAEIPILYLHDIVTSVLFQINLGK